MAAYAALVSVMQTIHQIEHHPSPPISMDKKQVESLTDIVMFLQEFLEGYKSPYADSDEADPLEMRIADAVNAAEDVIESHIFHQIRPDVFVWYIEVLGNMIKRPFSESVGSSTFANSCMSMEKLKEDMDLIEKNVREDVREMVALKVERWASASSDLQESLQEVIQDMDLIKKEVVALKDQQVSSSAGSLTSSKESSLSRLNNSTMVGFDDVMLQLMEKLIYGEPGRQVIPIVGMGGIGKTTLAINVYAHPSISNYFDICAWVTISQQFNTRELLCEILTQVDKEGKERLSQMKEDEIGLALHKCLSYRRYFIVLDDMWSVEAWEKLQCYFPDNSNGSRILVTTRLSNLGSQLDRNDGLEMKFLDEVSSWNMFCKIVFGGRSCPLELEKIGRKIVESCRGLPLSIVVMGGVLGKLEPTKECWKSIRGSINSLVNLDNDKHCLKILKLSYNHLAIHLKPCFLYMGTYEEDKVIRVSTIIKLWVSEGFLKPIRGKSLETTAKEYINELIDRNLILAHRFGKTGSMKYLKIHDLLRDFCLREAERERFYHVVGQHSPQGTCSQRRVVIPGSTPEEKVVDAIKSRPYARTCISHCERVQPLSNLRLLRTCISDGKRFQPLPGFRLFRTWKTYRKDVYRLVHLFELVNLRLLIVHFENYFTRLPSSIDLLWSIQTLIVTSEDDIIYAPVEIWNMTQLRHVHFYGFSPIRKNATGVLHLPDPPSDKIVIMENLQTLKRVMNFKCDEMMVRRIPNIKKLGLNYDRLHDGYCLHNIERLQKLESFHIKGDIRDEDSLRSLTFPQSLKSLTLQIENGRMEEILEKVSTLPLLQKLKLRDGCFRTGKWETVEGQFQSLKYLVIRSCSGLERWMMESSHFPCLEHLHLSFLRDLKVPAEVGEIPTLKSVVLFVCSESVVKSAKRIEEEQKELQGEEQLSFRVTVRKLR